MRAGVLGSRPFCTLDEGDIFLGGAGTDHVVNDNYGIFHGGVGNDFVFANYGTFYGGPGDDSVNFGNPPVDD